jgi:acyl carrier protein
MSRGVLNGAITEGEIRQRIHDFILDKLLNGEDPVNLTDSTPLVSGGIIDSLNSLNIGLFLEKSFEIKLAPEELANPENMETITSIAKLVISKILVSER